MALGFAFVSKQVAVVGSFLVALLLLALLVTVQGGVYGVIHTGSATRSAQTRA